MGRMSSYLCNSWTEIQNRSLLGRILPLTLLHHKNSRNILASDPTKLSDEKCTCVNNRCIRSKISGDNLDCRRVELSVNCDATGNRWAANNDITRCDREVELVGDQNLKSVLQFEEWEPDPAEAGPLGPRLSNPVEQERNAAITRRAGGAICSFCSVSNSPLTQ